MSFSEKHTFAFFCPKSLTRHSGQVSQILMIDDLALTNRISKILRMATGDQFILFDDTHHARVELLKINAKNLECLTLTFAENLNPSAELTIAVGAVRQSVFEEIVQNCAAIGASNIIQVKTEKSQASGMFNEQRAHSIAIGAREQSKNFAPVTILPSTTLEALINHVQAHTKLFADPSGSIITSQALELNTKPVLFLVGPPEGFSEKELFLIKNHNFQPINLGKNILKTELAATLAAGITRAIAQ